MTKNPEKERIRTRMKLERCGFPPGAASEASIKICAALSGLEPLLEARVVCAFSPARGEPDIRAFLADALSAGKELFLPKYFDEEGLYRMCSVSSISSGLAPGRFGIMEPVEGSFLPAEKARGAVWMVPGLAFSTGGGRIGFGAGVFDSLLEHFRGCVKVGVCFDFQVIADLPSCAHDQRMDLIVTEKRTIYCANKKELTQNNMEKISL